MRLLCLRCSLVSSKGLESDWPPTRRFSSSDGTLPPFGARVNSHRRWRAASLRDIDPAKLEAAAPDAAENGSGWSARQPFRTRVQLYYTNDILRCISRSDNPIVGAGASGGECVSFQEGDSMSPRDEILELARQHLGHDNLLTVPRSFIDVTGDHFSALVLSQLLYWTDRTSDPEGWVYKSHAQWKDELCMGRSVVDRARQRLVTLGLLQETHRKARGMRVMHFRLDMAALRIAVLSLAPSPDSCNAESCTPADPDVGNQQTALSNSGTPSTETTAETSSQTTLKTTSQTSSETSPEINAPRGEKHCETDPREGGGPERRGAESGKSMGEDGDCTGNSHEAASHGFRALSDLYRRPVARAA